MAAVAEQVEEMRLSIDAERRQLQHEQQQFDEKLNAALAAKLNAALAAQREEF